MYLISGLCLPITPDLIAPPNTTAMAMSSSSVIVMWDAITFDCSNVTSYEVAHNSSGENTTVMPTVFMTSVMISNLSAFTNITVSVAAMSDMEVGPPAVVMETTLLQGEQRRP